MGDVEWTWHECDDCASATVEGCDLLVCDDGWWSVHVTLPGHGRWSSADTYPERSQAEAAAVALARAWTERTGPAAALARVEELEATLREIATPGRGVDPADPPEDQARDALHALAAVRSLARRALK